MMYYFENTIKYTDIKEDVTSKSHSLSKQFKLHSFISSFWSRDMFLVQKHTKYLSHLNFFLFCVKTL